MTTIENKSKPKDFFKMVCGSEEMSSAKTNQSDHDSVYRQDASTVKYNEDLQPMEHNLPADITDMPYEVRRVLVHLMRQGVIIAAQKPKLFELICRYESYVRRHLSEVFLRLVLDAKSGVVFVARSDGEHGENGTENDTEEAGEDFVSLISKRTLSLYDTLLLLVLRKHYQDRESTGEQKITIDIDRIESYLIPFLPLTDHASLDKKKLVARVKEMVNRKVLSAIRGSDDRYEISPVIRYVVDAAFLESMLNEYQCLADEAGINYTNTDVTNSLSDISDNKLES